MTRKHTEIEDDHGTLAFEGGVPHDEGKVEDSDGSALSGML
jgi:hypothetical protein